MTDADKVINPDGVSPEWMTARLHEVGLLPADVEVTATNSARIGTGQMSVCHRIHLRYSSPHSQAPSTIVGKFASDNHDVRAMVYKSYEKEVGFYQKLAPRTRISVARCYYAAVDPESLGCTLLLEDLSGLEPGDQLRGLTLDEAPIVVEELIGLHAPLWNHPDLPWEDCLVPINDIPARQAMYGVGVPIFLERYGEALGRARSQVLAALVHGTSAWAETTPPSRTVVHRDFRLDNLLFDRRGRPVGVVAVDFQSACTGVGQVDVAYLLGTSLTTELRRPHEEALVRLWHDGLLAAGISEYSFGECLEDYRWSTVDALETSVLGAVYSDRTPRGDAMFIRMVSGQVDQVLDFDADLLLK